jgi:PAS domain S-box-containing protein
MSLVEPDALSLQLTIESLASDLCESAGASGCAFYLRDRVDHQTFVSVGPQPRLMLPWSDRDVGALLAEITERDTETVDQIDGLIAYGIPLRLSTRALGAVLLIFPLTANIDTLRIAAAVRMTARAAQMYLYVETVQEQDGEINEGIQLSEIQISRNLIRGVIDSVPIGLMLIQADGSIRAINRPLADRFGREPAEMVGQFYGQMIGPWEESPAAETIRTSEPQRSHRSVQMLGRSHEQLEIASFPIFDPMGRPYQVVEVWEDITERVALQTQLVRAEKLAGIGQLAASIAHEVGNPLQAIQGFLALFLEQCAPETPNQHFLELAEDEIERIVHVLARLRDLYRPRADVVVPTDMNGLIESVLLLTGKQLERVRVRVRTELAADLPKIDMVADQIKQVVLNLVLNAADAMSGGGLLHFQTYSHQDRDGAMVATMTITDTGIGIPAEQLPYIFDGLHTTKERGMGLGLYTSKAIIERHMGRIMVQSQIGEGTTFVITLPVQEPELNALTSQKKEPQ